jgi:hypothetical protein
MTKYINLLLLCFAIVLCSSQCKKTKPTTPLTELEKLPSITQTGANTFGCLVDGIAWLPNGTKPQNGGSNIQLYVDPTFQGGAFYVTGHQYNAPTSFVSIGSGNCTNSGIYEFTNNVNSSSYKKSIPGSLACELFSSGIGTYKSGFLNISKYDLTSGIFSGTFEFKLFNSQSLCGDTIRITNGRFDVKL